MSKLRIAGLVVLGVILLLFAVVGVLSTFQGTPISRVASVGESRPAAVADTAFIGTVEVLTRTELERGNQVEVLANGAATYPRLWRDLRAARRSISFQTYYGKPGQVADSLSAILRERARAGVKVAFLYDAVGASSLTDGYLDSLRAAGVRVGEFRPPAWWNLNRLQRRSHVRAAVIDTRIGYTGGFGIDDKWLGNGRSESEWRDTNVRFTGPAVEQLQGAFAAQWAEARHTLLTGDLYFPHASWPEGGPQLAGVLFAAPTIGSTPGERYYALSITGARRTLYIANAYFVPDDDLQRFLAASARQGVDVRVLTAGEKTDVKSVLWAGRDRYEGLLQAGVRIYEYQPAMMHAKTLSADGLWCSVGGMNFDNRSVALNDEATLLIRDPAVCAGLDSLFLADLRLSREIRLDRFRQRGWFERLKEKGASLMARML